MLGQMESGHRAVPPPLAQSMTQMYSQPGSDVVIMTRLARHRDAADCSAWNLDQLAWESCATRVCELAVTHIPELLQTSDYARSVFISRIRRTCHGEVPVQTIRTSLASLALRQSRLAGLPLLPMHVVITESALRTQAATLDVMAGQWAHLKTVAASCAVTVRVLPDAGSGLIGSQHGWRLLEFSTMPEPRWLFRRYGRVTAPTEGQEVGTAYRKFLRLRAASLSPDDSRTFIQQLIDDATQVGK
jgi:hypothetical protein